MSMLEKSASMHGREFDSKRNEIDDAYVHCVESDSKIKHVHTS